MTNISKNNDYQDYLRASANAVVRQAEETGLGIPGDPDVAEFMGAFKEEAVDLEDTEE